MSCIKCGSQAINHNCHGRDGSDGDLCDVCYWRKRAEAVPPAEKRCKFCNYQFGHAIGCFNNPVDIALRNFNKTNPSRT